MYTADPQNASNFVAGVDLAFMVILGISIFFLIALTVVMLVFIYRYKKTKHPKAIQNEGSTRLEIIWTAVGIFMGRSSDTYQWMYTNFNLPLSSTAYAATLFYLASATYRVIRARSTETTILVVVSIVVIMGNMPMFVTYIPALMTVKNWLAEVVVTAAYRAITIGVGLGGILMGVRTLLAMETGFLGGTED